jgi:hypothetical protein
MGDVASANFLDIGEDEQFCSGAEKHFASRSAVVCGLSISSNLEILADAPGP